MPTFIVSLIPFSAAFKNAVIHYCQATGNPSTPEHHQEIFKNCLSQICFKMDMDANTFMLNLMELPDWRVIHYLDTPIDYNAIGFFRDAMRIFAIGVWENLRKHVTTETKYTYILESCNLSMAVISVYVDAGDL